MGYEKFRNMSSFSCIYEFLKISKSRKRFNSWTRAIWKRQSVSDVKPTTSDVIKQRLRLQDLRYISLSEGDQLTPEWEEYGRNRSSKYLRQEKRWLEAKV